MTNEHYPSGETLLIANRAVCELTERLAKGDEHRDEKAARSPADEELTQSRERGNAAAQAYFDCYTRAAAAKAGIEEAEAAFVDLRKRAREAMVALYEARERAA
eukprot:7511219-Pyramimonas_sp.AAC.1